MWQFDNRIVPDIHTELPGPKAQALLDQAREIEVASLPKSVFIGESPVCKHPSPLKLGDNSADRLVCYWSGGRQGISDDWHGSTKWTPL